MRKLILTALVCSLCSAGAALAQTPKQTAPTLPTMKCAAYLQLKATKKTAQLRDFCAGHPDSTIAEAEPARKPAR